MKDLESSLKAAETVTTPRNNRKSNVSQSPVKQSQQGEGTALVSGSIDSSASGIAGTTSDDIMMLLLEQQSKILQNLTSQSSRPPQKKSTINVAPRVNWPTLNDETTSNGREVELFFRKIEEITDIMNDGDGMPDREKLIALRRVLEEVVFRSWIIF